MSNLVAYGIQNEKSDYRAHVSPFNARVYVYRTEDGRAIIDTGKYAKRTAKTNGEISAEGYAVPVSDIPRLIEVIIPKDIWLGAGEWREKDSTSEKGRKAMYVVCEMLKRNMIPVVYGNQIGEVTDKNLQIIGADIYIVSCRIQVKCDMPARSTGNLFIQIAERNLIGAH